MEKSSLRNSVMVAMFGLSALVSSLSKDRVAALHDAGFCFGVAFAVAIGRLLTRKERSAGK